MSCRVDTDHEMNYFLFSDENEKFKKGKKNARAKKENVGVMMQEDPLYSAVLETKLLNHV